MSGDKQKGDKKLKPNLWDKILSTLNTLWEDRGTILNIQESYSWAHMLVEC